MIAYNYNFVSFLKRLVRSNSFLFCLIYHLKLLLLPLFVKLFYRIGNAVEDKSLYSSIYKDIIGCDNYLRIGTKSRIYGLKIHIRGKNNKIIIGHGCVIGKECSFWIEGDSCSIIIGDFCTFTHTVHLCAQEYATSINIGDDCMLSNNIILRTSDSHPVYNDKHMRINKANSIFISKHVWIAPHATIMKGVSIGEGALIASNSVVTKNIPEYCLAAGIPAKIVKEKIYWSRERLF